MSVCACVCVLACLHAFMSEYVCVRARVYVYSLVCMRLCLYVCARAIFFLVANFVSAARALSKSSGDKSTPLCHGKSVSFDGEV